MVTIPVFINKKDEIKLRKLCEAKGCNSYQLAKSAIQKMLEEAEKHERERGKDESGFDSGRNQSPRKKDDGFGDKAK